MRRLCGLLLAAVTLASSARAQEVDLSNRPPLRTERSAIRHAPLPRRSQTTTAGQVLNSTWVSPLTIPVGPPDPSGACGPRGLVSITNNDVAYLDKSGATYYRIATPSFFSPAHSGTLFYDPRALYDPRTSRFFMTVLETPAPPAPPSGCGSAPASSTFGGAWLWVAISTSSHPTGSADWIMHSYDVKKVVGSGGSERHYTPDYPSLAVDSLCVTVAANYFEMPIPCGGQDGIGIITFSKAALLSETATPAITFSNSSGEYALQAVSNLSPPGQGNVTYLVEMPSTTNAVRLWALQDPLGTRTLSSTTVVVPDHGASGGSGFYTLTPVPQCPPSSGTNYPLRGGAGVAHGMCQWVNGSLWLCETGFLPTTGTADRTAVNYYRIATSGYPGGTPGLQESGTVDAGSGIWNFSPSLFASPNGDVVLTFTQSSSAQCPNMMVASRPAGATSFTTPVLVAPSPEFHADLDPGLGLVRWGDYAAAMWDPIDTTLWVTHMTGVTGEQVGGAAARIYFGNVLFDDLNSGWPAGGRMVRRGQTRVAALSAASDGSGGAIFSWWDTRTSNTGFQCRVLRMTSAGAVAAGWVTNGTQDGNCGATASTATLADGAGGAYTVRLNSDLQLNRLTGAGVPAPGWSSTPLTVASGITQHRAAVDGSGGVLLAYSKSGTGIRVQKISGSGTLTWGTPPTVTTTSIQPEVCDDNAGGAYVAWVGSSHVLLKHVTSAGSIDSGWPAGGVDLGAGTSAPRLVPDGAGGVYVVYSASTDLFAIRILSTGAVASGWTGGKTVVSATGTQNETAAVADGSGGLLVAWSDARDAATTDLDIYVNRLTSSGSLAAGWPPNGRRVCGAGGTQRRPALTDDGAGGALVTWIDARANVGCTGPGCGEDIYWSHVLATGIVEPGLDSDGKAVSTAVGDQTDPVILRSGGSEAIVAWLDGQLTLDGDPAYVTRVLATKLAFDTTPVGVANPGDHLADGLGLPHPNPTDGSTELMLTISSKHPGGSALLDVFDISGRRVRRLYSGPSTPGRSPITWDLRNNAGNVVHSGLYYIRLTLPGSRFTRTVVVP